MPTTPASSSDSPCIKLRVPTAWGGLTDGQLLYVCRLLASGQWSDDEVKALLLARIADGEAVRLLRRTPRVMADALAVLEWMDTPPADPVRPDRIGQAVAADAMLAGVPFRTYLSVENYWQGYLLTSDNRALDAILPLLFTPDGKDGRRSDRHGRHADREACQATVRYALMLWITGLKQAYARMFPDLFRPSADDGAARPDAREVMNAEIRALTGGDVTKVAAVMEADTIDALTELDAKAREAREMNERMKR